MSRVQFLVQGIKNFSEVGAVARSSKAMCEKMVHYIDTHSEHVMELGAGDGVITRFILDKMSPTGILLAFEINDHMLDQLQKIDDPRLIIIKDSAENLDIHLAQHNITALDAVVSAIPFLVVPKKVAELILDKCHKALKPGAPYTQVHYAKRLKGFYKGVFGNIKIHFVLKNIPPSYVFYCKR
jgi:phospholipid N-methyltransferase